MKKLFYAAVMLLVCSVLSAQEAELFRLEAEVRVDYMQEYLEDDKVDAASGFKGKYLNFRIDGKIAEGLTYSWRQRLNNVKTNSSFFDDTDWATVNYNIGRWNFNAGRQVVGIGGYEYDMAPIDCYFNSEYWNNIACYQFGVSASYEVRNKGDNLLFQLCESPFRRNALNVSNKEMFAYNLMWYGNHGCFSSIYSLNMVEWMPGRFINYITLGNRFVFGDFDLELDYMNRAVSFNRFIGGDMSVMADFAWHVSDRVTLFAKLTYDVNNTDEIGDLCVTPGTDILRVGGGIEYYPLKSTKNLRLHLNCCYADGKSPVSAVIRPKQTIVDAGVTWRMKLLDLKRKN